MSKLGVKFSVSPRKGRAIATISRKIISRDKAKSRGLTRYFTGRPCPSGHICERTVSGFGCVECAKSREKVSFNRCRLKKKKCDLVVISRSDARKRKLKRYFTGLPCCRGHISDRLTSSANCTECHNTQTLQWKKRNLEHDRKKRFEWIRKNRKSYLAAAKRNKISAKLDEEERYHFLQAAE